MVRVHLVKISLPIFICIGTTLCQLMYITEHLLINLSTLLVNTSECEFPPVGLQLPLVVCCSRNTEWGCKSGGEKGNMVEVGGLCTPFRWFGTAMGESGGRRVVVVVLVVRCLTVVEDVEDFRLDKDIEDNNGGLVWWVVEVEVLGVVGLMSGTCGNWGMGVLVNIGAGTEVNGWGENDQKKKL